MFLRSKFFFKWTYFKKRIAEVKELEKKPGEMFWLISGHGWSRVGWMEVWPWLDHFSGCVEPESQAFQGLSNPPLPPLWHLRSECQGVGVRGTLVPNVITPGRHLTRSPSYFLPVLGQRVTSESAS